MEIIDRSVITKFLKGRYSEGVFHTHVSLFSPKGKFLIERNAIEEFWDIYCKCNKNMLIGLAEKPQEYAPVLVDVDLKLLLSDEEGNEGNEDSLYTLEEIKTVIEAYQSILRRIVDDVKDEYLICALLEKDQTIIEKGDKRYIKRGVHLHFPYCFLDRKMQDVHLIPRVKDILIQKKLFNRLNYFEAEYIDNSSVRNPWLLYGARKNEHNEPYALSLIFNSNLESISFKKAFRDYQLFDKDDQLIDIRGNIDYYLPRIFSILPYNRQTLEVKRGLLAPGKEKQKKEKKDDRVYSTNVIQNTKTAAILTKLLKLARANDRNMWMEIGWILYNITEGSPEGLEIWLQFSERCEESYDEGICTEEWDKMIMKEKGMGSLKFYAKSDSPEEYKKYLDEEKDKKISDSLSGSHNDIAKILYAEYADEFVCSNITGRTWFQFTGHIWKRIDQGVFLSEKISNEVVTMFIEQKSKLYTQLADPNIDKSTSTHLNNKVKIVEKRIGELKSHPFKNNVMKECCEVFYNEKFADKLDANPRLIAFRNGVMELRPESNLFRKGEPEDYLSKCIPKDYIEYAGDEDTVQEVFSYLEKVFPDKEVRQYFLDMSSDLFVGGNHQKKVYFWTGEGDNAKSVTQTMLEKLFGPLAIKFNTNVFTGKKPGQGSTNAELSRAGGGVRMAVMEEPDGDETINNGALKGLSGNDSYFARDLFEKGKDTREIVPLFKLVFICNRLPRLKYSDKAVWNRIRVIPFESTFKEKAPESYEEQLQNKHFPVDREFGGKIDNLLSPFAWILLKNRVTPHIRFEPTKVTNATEVYRQQNDVYRKYIEECIYEEKEKVLALSELYSNFKEWFREANPNTTIPNRNDVEEYFIKIWGTPDKGKIWKGFKIQYGHIAQTNSAHSSTEDKSE